MFASLFSVKIHLFGNSSSAYGGAISSSCAFPADPLTSTLVEPRGGKVAAFAPNTCYLYRYEYLSADIYVPYTIHMNIYFRLTTSSSVHVVTCPSSSIIVYSTHQIGLAKCGGGPAPRLLSLLSLTFVKHTFFLCPWHTDIVCEDNNNMPPKN